MIRKQKMFAYLFTLGYQIIRGDGIILSWVENQRFNRPKTKKCITEGKIIFQKLISGGERLLDTREYTISFFHHQNIGQAKFPSAKLKLRYNSIFNFLTFLKRGGLALVLETPKEINTILNYSRWDINFMFGKLFYPL